MDPAHIPPANDGDGSSVARLLIVDDEPDGAKTLGMLLERLGYPVLVVTDSTQCIEQLESFKPDVIFLDIAMPNLSGYDLAGQIRSRPGFEEVAIIAISGYADQEHSERSIDAGFDLHLAKPVQLIALEAAIGDRARTRRPR